MNFRLTALLAALALSLACGPKNNGSENNGQTTGPEDMGNTPDMAQPDAGEQPVVVDDETSIADLSDEQRAELCSEIVAAAGGAQELTCSAEETRAVFNVGTCSATLAGFQPCATVGATRDCYAAWAACEQVDRDTCWFMLGDDGTCTAPYLGVERTPVALQVLPPVPADCENPGAMQRIPFTIPTTDVIPLVPGDIVNGLIVEPGLTLDAGSIALKRPRVSELTETVCTSDAECASGMMCATAGLPGAPRQCTRQSPVTFVPGSIRADFDPGVDEDKQQLVGVLIENTALLEGRLPTASGSLFDESGEKDLLTEPTRASDPTRIHRASIKDFVINLASVADPINTAVSLWWYAGQVSAEARPLINASDLEDHFNNDLSVGEALIDSMPNPVPKPSNLWQGVLAMIRKDFNLDKYAEHEKFLFIFADGPNEVHDDEATFDQVVAAAESIGLHIYVVHLDAALDPSLIRDVPTYWAGNDNCQDDPACTGAPTCANDSSCSNFEECRPATVYAEDAGGTVTTTPQSYCMPRYNDEGRLGPIDQFADLACRTGGSYMYVTKPEQMRPYWRALPGSINGQYSIEADFSALESSDFADGWYRLSGVFLGILGTRDLGQALTAPRTDIEVDNRAILRMGR